MIAGVGMLFRHIEPLCCLSVLAVFAGCGPGVPVETADSEIDLIADAGNDVFGTPDAGIDVFHEANLSDVDSDRQVVSDTADVADCQEPTPYLLNGQCVECRECGDCPGPYPHCSELDHVCVAINCSGSSLYCAADCDCHQCCFDDDCNRFPSGTGVCLPDGTCEGYAPCEGLCTPDFPVCAFVAGQEQCVQCFDDADCATLFPGLGCTCVGDPLYSCVNENGAICGSAVFGCTSTCASSQDCPPLNSGVLASCHLPDGETEGRCYDPDGSCSGTSLCCGPGMSCYDMEAILHQIYPTVLTSRIIAKPERDYTACGCAENTDCINGRVCTDMSAICEIPEMTPEMLEILCPDGKPHELFPTKLCGSLNEIILGRAVE